MLQDKEFYSDISNGTTNKLKDIINNNVYFDQILKNDEENIDLITSKQQEDLKKGINDLNKVRPSPDKKKGDINFIVKQRTQPH